MLHTEKVPDRVARLIPPYRDRIGSEVCGLKKVKQRKRQYEKRKAAGLCTSTGCREKPDVGHTHCQKHLVEMSKRNKEQYQRRTGAHLCIYCGVQPQFWGVRCVICRRFFTKHPLPYGARRALRLYREAEDKRDREQLEVEVRHAVRKLLATGEINGRRATAWRLYAGVDDGKWRTYGEVGKVMRITKQGVRNLLVPSKITLARVLGDRVPWRPMQKDLKHNGNKSLSAELEAIHCCDNPVARIDRREPRSYERLPEVILAGVSVYRCENCQTEVTLIPRQRELDKALAQLVLLKPASLAGKDLQFLRKASQLTIEALSELLGVNSSTLSAWETSAALRYTNDLAARVVLASLLDQRGGPRLIIKILGSIRIGIVELDPIHARWSDAEGEWIIESATP